MGSIRVVRAGDIPRVPTAEVSTDKWARKVIDVDDRVSINETHNRPGAVSAWHHHGDNTGYVYVVEGQVRLEWGPDGREIADLAAGDFYVIAPNTIHREANPGPKSRC